MASWRDSASPEAQRALDGLLGAALGFAQQQLAEHGEFFPYAVVDSNGAASMIAVDLSAVGHRPASQDVIDACVRAAVDRRDEIQASAIVADFLTESGDAIRVDLEHAEGVALRVLLPYATSGGGQGVEYGPLRAEAGPFQIWTHA